MTDWMPTQLKKTSIRMIKSKSKKAIAISLKDC